MFTQPTVNQIASAYKGNPEPLNAKVEADKKKNGGIPQDLRQLMAAYDLSQGRQNMGIQQALQIPTNMPTVAENVQERARQALQALMVQQAQEQQRKNGQPNIVPPGIPRPPMQAQGLDSLESNVGDGYAEGGIIGFSTGNKVKETEEEKKARQREEDRRALLEPLAAVGDIAQLPIAAGYNLAANAGSGLERFLNRIGSALTGKEVNTQSDDQVGNKFRFSPTPFTDMLRKPTEREVKVAEQDRQKNAVVATDPAAIRSQLNAADAGFRAQPGTPPPPPAPPKANINAQTRVNADNAPMPGGLKDLVSTQATPGGDYLRKMLNQDENALAAAKRALYDKEVGARDLSIFDKTAAELEARKQKLNAPKTGFDATMEYLEQIALGGGRSSFESGALGAARQRQLQLAREGKQNELMDKILELGAKKSEAQFAERKGMFDLTQAEKDRIIKEKTEAAGKLGLSEDKTRELIEQGLQKELDRKNEIRKAGIVAQDRDQLMNRARALMAADPTKKMTLEEAMRRAAMAAGATQMEGIDVRKLGEYNKAAKEIQSRYMPVLLERQTPEGARMRAKLAAELAEARLNAGLPPEQGLNALPTTQGAPLPPKNQLVAGQIYQTAKGPAKWNGTAFEQ
jgi:anaerobic ribonucleoside-triphosphate reductase